MSNQEVNLSKKTRRGILVLVCICLVIIYTPRLLILANPPKKIKLSYSELPKIAELNSNKARAEYQKKAKFEKRVKFQRPPKKFNPNEYSREEWISLGLSEKQVNVVLKFTKNGLRSNDDLHKIFVISEPLYQLIKDSTFYPTKSKRIEEKDLKDDANRVKATPKFELIELNTSDVSELESVPGIGPFFAKMIIKKRDELGGFVSKEQLLEVYKMEVEKYNEIEKYFRINPEITTKLNINEASFVELRAHPYIDSKVANSIVKMRLQKGSYKSIEELKESKLITSELFLKLKPYVYL